MHGSLQPERDLLQLDQDSLWDRLQHLRDSDDSEMSLTDELDSGSRPSSVTSTDSHDSVETNDITALHQQWLRRRERLRVCQGCIPTLRRRLADFEGAFKRNGVQQEGNSDTVGSSDDDSAAADSDWEPRRQPPAQNTKSCALWEGHPELASAHEKHASKLARAYEKIARYEQLVGQARERWDRAVQVGKKQQHRQQLQHQRQREREEAETARQMAELQAQRQRRIKAQRDAERKRMQEQKAQEMAAAAAEHERQKTERPQSIAEIFAKFARGGDSHHQRREQGSGHVSQAAAAVEHERQKTEKSQSIAEIFTKFTQKKDSHHQRREQRSGHVSQAAGGSTATGAVTGQQAGDVSTSERVAKRRRLDPIRRPLSTWMSHRSSSTVSLDSISDIE
jgi:hypothetical protein